MTDSTLFNTSVIEEYGIVMACQKSINFGMWKHIDTAETFIHQVTTKA
jgi:hypothetical protein